MSSWAKTYLALRFGDNSTQVDDSSCGFRCRESVKSCLTMLADRSADFFNTDRFRFISPAGSVSGWSILYSKSKTVLVIPVRILLGLFYVACMRMAESRRMVSPFKTGFSIMALTSRANSAGLPKRAGNGSCF